MNATYRPRNDFVVLEIVKRGKSRGGVVLPEKSRESTTTFVVAVGPKVEDLEVGDQVLAIGTPNQDIISLPREKDVVVTREANCILVVTDEKDE
jgi:co-chaperonin GroES (HSP10)